MPLSILSYKVLSRIGKSPSAIKSLRLFKVTIVRTKTRKMKKRKYKIPLWTRMITIENSKQIFASKMETKTTSKAGWTLVQAVCQIAVKHMS